MKRILLHFTFCMVLLSGTGLYAQVAINATGANPHASAMFDISSTSKGLLIPRMTLSQLQAIVSPATGLLVYNTSDQAIYNFNGSTWAMLKAANPAKLQDADGNTTVDAEFTLNNDMIYFRLGGNTKMILKSNRLEFINANNNLFIGENAGFTNSSGNFNLAIGKEALYSNSTGFRNIAIGYHALYSNTSSTDNTAVGYAALGLSISVGNTAFGSLALSSNTTGIENTSLGSNALALNETGSYNTAGGSTALYTNSASHNTAFGYASLFDNTTGNQNTAVGSLALTNNLTGINNVATGYVSMLYNSYGNENTATGVAALYNNQTGHNNSAFGREALRDNANSDNTAVGYRAAMDNYTGIQNVAIGSNSLINNETGSFHTAIGYNTGPNASNLANTTTLGIDARATATDMVRIGNVYVNTIGGQVGWTTFSDGRFKENVREDVPGLSFINQLRPVTYNVNRSSFNDFVGLSGSTLASDAAYISRQMSERTTGFIAQEVESSAKAMGFDFSGVDSPDNPDDYYGLRYAEFVVPLVKAVQELSAQNAAQQQMIDELIAKNREMQQQLEAQARHGK